MERGGGGGVERWKCGEGGRGLKPFYIFLFFPRSSPPPRPGYGPPMHRGPNHSSRDARHDIIRREEQRRDLMERRLGADPYYHRDGSRQVNECACSIFLGKVTALGVLCCFALFV